MKITPTARFARFAGRSTSAPSSGVTYDPTTSGLTADDLQDAIDELAALIGAIAPATLDGLTDVTITAPASDDTLRYDGSGWINTRRRWEPVTFDPGTGPEMVFDATDGINWWKDY